VSPTAPIRQGTDGVYANQFFGFRYTVSPGLDGAWRRDAEGNHGDAKGNRRRRDQNKRRVMEAASKRTFQLLTVFEYPLGTPNKTTAESKSMAENRRLAREFRPAKTIFSSWRRIFPLARCILSLKVNQSRKHWTASIFYHQYGHSR